MWRQVAVVAIVGLLVGCYERFGTGGTGEMVVPTEQLRQIQPANLESLSTTRPTTAPATLPTTMRTDAPPPPQIDLTLAEARQIALENNLDLRVELLSPTIAKESITEEQAQFETLLFGNARYTRTDSPTASQLTSAQSKDLTTDVGIEVPLRTGGTLRFDVPVNRRETNNQFATLNPAYTSDFNASITQPLLRGAGTDANAHGIRIAFYQYQASQARTKLEIIRVLANVERTYWRLYAARRELEVRKGDYDLAIAQLERARRLVRAGVGVEVDVARAESAAADKLEGIIIAENQAQDRQRELKRVLNRPDLSMDGPTTIVPASKPTAVFYDLDTQRTMHVALNQRMEMLEQELRIAEETANVAFARNGLLPLVVLDYTYSINGLGPMTDDSFDMLADKDFEDHTIGIRAELPLGNEAAKSRLRRALARRLQELATRDQRSLLIQQEVLTSLGELNTTWQRAWAAQKRVVLAQRLWEQETRRFGGGMNTMLDVLDAQARLANAQSAEVAAITEYQIAQIDIAFATGTLLGASKVSWQPAQAPKR